jgi:hypothetical protein
MFSGNFAEMAPFLRHLGIFYKSQICEGRRAEEFFAQKSDRFGRV